MHLADKLACTHIKELEPYQSARRIGGSGNIWINANELPFATGEYEIDSSTFHRYPDHSPDQLMQAYADYAGLPRDNVLATRGADEGIELLIRAFCYPGKDSICQCPPTYGLYEISANIHDTGVYQAVLKEDLNLDLDAIFNAPANTKIVFLCNPNNPTGNAFHREDLLRIVEHYKDKALVAVDEAYMEFSPQSSLVDAISEHDNLVILRTLSKAFGLAGVHLGFVLAQKAVLDVLNRMISPYPIGEPCAQIGAQALSKTGIDKMQKSVSSILTVRDDFSAQLRSLACVQEILPSSTNFLLVRFSDQKKAWEQLTQAGIVARVHAHPMLKDAIRFSVGTEEEMQLCIDALT